MLIKSEVDRRIDTLSKYVFDLKDKVYSQRYNQAKELIHRERKSINDNYISPYNPNTFVIDSLKSRREKLCKQIMILDKQVKEKKELQKKQQLKRGYSLSQESYCSKFESKMVGMYISRFPITLADTNKLEYEVGDISTDFNVLKLVLEDGTSSTMSYRTIISFQISIYYILISWKHENTGKQNYLMLKFHDDQDKEKWCKIIKLSKIIHDSSEQKYLFLPQTQQQEEQIQQIKYDKLQKYEKPEKVEQSGSFLMSSGFVKNQKPKQMQYRTSYGTHRGMLNLNLNKNKNPQDRFRRQSDFVEDGNDGKKSQNLVQRVHNSKERKISQDLTSKNFLSIGGYQQNQIFHFKSQKSFDNSKSQSHSSQDLVGKRQAKIEQPHFREEKQENRSFTKKESQDLLHESSIKWIQQQEEENSNLDRGSNLRPFSHEKHRFQQEQISEQPAQVEQSPLLPFNLKQKQKEKEKNLFKLQPVETNQEEQENFDEIIKEEQYEDEKRKTIRNIIEGKKELQKEEEVNQVEDEHDPNDSNKDAESQHPSEAESAAMGAQILKQGIILDKCAENGWKPHLKRLYLSQGQSELCWVNVKGDDFKKIKLSQIVSVNYAQYGKGIAKHIEKIEKGRCMTIKYYKDNSSKDMQFILPDTTDKEKLIDFSDKLDKFVNFKKKSF